MDIYGNRDESDFETDFTPLGILLLEDDKGEKMDKWVQVEQIETFRILPEDLDEYLENPDTELWVETGQISIAYAYVTDGITGTYYDTLDKLVEIEGK